MEIRLICVIGVLSSRSFLIRALKFAVFSSHLYPVALNPVALNPVALKKKC
ncbi:hypothetical protein [Candidatus Methanoperedens nitratireducens]|uniref:hypothetical protein n=1 Tax=Candidatus Methanoperedens nitratireducens TaxID=1392998 RepID=UPI0012FEF629|nr:hypothetical protein [Candidatus Methanoperedens nitroreducens]